MTVLRVCIMLLIISLEKQLQTQQTLHITMIFSLIGNIAQNCSKEHDSNEHHLSRGGGVMRCVETMCHKSALRIKYKKKLSLPN